MSPLKRPILAAFAPALGALAIACAGLSAGCATATSDDGEKAAGGDASIAGRPDAAEPGIRPDADTTSVPVDAGVGSADAAVSPADANPQCVTSAINLLANGDFDLGPASWVENSGGTPTPYALIVSDSEIGGVTADSGTFLTWLGGYSSAAAVDVFHQDLVVPADATPMTVTGKIWIDSAEAPFFAWDVLRLAVVNPTSGAVLEQVASWSNLDLGTGWTNLSHNVTGNYAGQTVRFRFTAELDSTNNTSFLLDTLSLNTTSCQ